MMLVLTKVLTFCFFISSCFGGMNVLFLVADDMRPQLEVYKGSNYPAPVSPKMHTPNLDSLASQSLLLERAYVQEALCSPSRTSLLTGRRPDTTHVYKIGPYFREVGGNFTTIPQYFDLHGYTSIGMGKVFHQGHASGNDDPVSWSKCKDECTSERDSESKCGPECDTYFHGEPNFESHDKSWDAIPDDLLRDKPLIDEQIAEHAMKTLDRLAPNALSGEKPFFLAVGFHKPHLPFVFPESFLQKYPDVRLPNNSYAPENMPDVAWYGYGGLRSYNDIKQLGATGAKNTILPDETTLKLRKAYYSALSWTDSLIGRVLDKLKSPNLDNNTIVSFWGDHGYSLGENAEWCKFTNFEVATHAPMMIHIPGRTDGGIRTNQLTEFVDLFPTLAEAAGLEPLPLCPKYSNDVQICREGESLLPLIDEPETPIKTASFSQFPRHDYMGYSMRTNQFRYTEWPKFKDEPDYEPDWTELGGVELYDHKIDPYENVNRADDPAYEKTRRKLHKMLVRGWRKA